MLQRAVLALPLGRIDALFVRGLAWLSPRVSGHACITCSQVHVCGSCDCPQGAGCGELLCDSCGLGDVCDCSCPPPPIC